MDALRAALANGADAVYLGASLFGARSNAGFDEEALKSAISLAHLHKRRVHVTVNTLVKDEEIPAVRQTLSMLRRLSADAVLVQDAGVLSMCLTEFPEIPVHASTQMTVHNAQGASFLLDLGVRRVVLARECSLDIIRRVAQTGIETEVFAHGALCVSVSGQCLFSSMIGGRSGNRGRCAQPCRLQYFFENKPGAWLSPRDLCVRDRLPELIDAGVASLKIEGRLKRPEYVAIVTKAYRKAIDAAQEGRFSPADDQEKKELIQIFCRGGFTEGRAFSKEDSAIIDPTRVKPIGVLIGQITRVREHQAVCLCDARLTLDLSDGDGLEVGDQAVIYSGPPVPAGQTATLRMHARPHIGDGVRRTDDERQLILARQTYEGEAFYRALAIPLTARLTAYPNQALELTLSDGEQTVTVLGESCQASVSKPLDSESATRSLSKTGGTPYRMNGIDVDTAGAFVPASALNALRRDALDALTQARVAATVPTPSPVYKAREVTSIQMSPALYVLTSDVSQAETLRSAGADTLLYSPRDARISALEADAERIKTFDYLCLPPFVEDETLHALIAFAKAHSLRLCLQNIGQIEAIHGIPYILGGDIPVMNGQAARFLASFGARAVTLSREMSGDQANKMDASIVPLLLPVYGRTRLMLLRHCPYRAAKGLSEGHADCARCFGKDAIEQCLNDRFGNALPLLPQKLAEGCMNALYAHQITDLLNQSLPSGVSYLVEFTNEPFEERLRVVRAFRDKLDGKPVASPGKRFIGRYAEGVQ